MGDCFSSSQLEDLIIISKRKANTDVTEELQTAERLNKQHFNLLLLGTTHSGRSTLFKSLKLITNDWKMDTEERIELRHVIRQNCVAGILTLLKKSQELYDSDRECHRQCLVAMDDEIVRAIQLVVNYGGENFSEQLNYDEVQQLGMANGIWLPMFVLHMHTFRSSYFFSVVAGRGAGNIQSAQYILVSR